ncbi:hypothetical protein SLS62_004342 [Diatrype stigma]|uniref:Heterokaryon incompatibility domain-containing protein n=1 Tax=Diatrype stigma TaxID=117547 RepID=A0AAN9V3B1_9PEZI
MATPPEGAVRQAGAEHLTRMRNAYGDEPADIGRENGGHLDVWIDALCINQEDIDEKNSQVPMMGDIYAQAAFVVAWLGEEDEHSKKAFELVRRWAWSEDKVNVRAEFLKALYNVETRSYDDSFEETDAIMLLYSCADIITPDLIEESLVDSLTVFMGRPYWQRIWIQQEISLARETFVCCGADDAVLLYHLRMVYVQLLLLKTVHASPILRKEWCPNHIKYLNSPLMMLGTTLNWQTLVGIGRKCTSTDPRDKIYGIMYMMRAWVQPTVDYGRPVRWAYANLVHCAAQQTGVLFIDGTNGVGQPKTFARLPGLPSWAPDLRADAPGMWFPEILYAGSERGLDVGLEGAGGSTKAISSSSFDTDRLEVTGIVVDRVRTMFKMKGANVDNIEQHWMALSCFMVKHANVPHPAGIPPLQAFFRALWGLGAPDVFRRTAYVRFAIGHIFALCNAQINARKKRQEYPLHAQTKQLFLGAPGDAAEKTLATDSLTRLSRDFLIATGVVEHLYGVCEEHNGLGGLLHLSEPELMAGFWGYGLGDKDKLLLSSERFEWPKTALSYAFELAKIIKLKRSIFVTEAGYIGVGPVDLRKGDEIRVLFGCRVPLLIRRVKRKLRVVGACFVYGMMDGEMVQKMHDGDFTPERFCLY